MTDDRYEIDLGDYLRGLLHWWWVIVALAVVGAVLGAGLTLAQPKTYLATSSIYLGQPTDASGAPIAALNTDPRAAEVIGLADSTIAQVVPLIGLGETTQRLRSGISVSVPPAATKSAIAPINIVTVGVHDSKPARAAAAANAIADVIVKRLAIYDQGKVALLTSQVASDDKRLAQLRATNDAAQKALAAIAAGGGAAATKAMASAPYLGIEQSATDEIQTLLDDKSSAALTLLVARGVEAPAIVTRASPPSTPEPRAVHLNTAVGLVVGLVVGLIVAALLEWRRREGAAA